MTRAQCPLLGWACVQHTAVGEVLPVLPVLACLSHISRWSRAALASHQRGCPGLTPGDLQCCLPDARGLPGWGSQQHQRGCCSALQHLGSKMQLLDVLVGSYQLPGAQGELCACLHQELFWSLGTAPALEVDGSSEMLGLAADLEVTKEERQVLQAKGALRRELCTWSSLPLV